MHDKFEMAADSVIITGGTIAGFSYHEIAGILILTTNLIYVIIRLVDRFKTGGKNN